MRMFVKNFFRGQIILWIKPKESKKVGFVTAQREAKVFLIAAKRRTFEATQTPQRLSFSQRSKGLPWRMPLARMQPLSEAKRRNEKSLVAFLKNSISFFY